MTKTDFEAILQADVGEFRIHHKLKDIHINCRGSNRQRVRTAALLLSRATAEALTFLFPNKERQSKMLLTVNDWFNTMNSCRITDQVKLRCAFGIHLDEQLEALRKMDSLIKTMKICKIDKTTGTVIPVVLKIQYCSKFPMQNGIAMNKARPMLPVM